MAKRKKTMPGTRRVTKIERTYTAVSMYPATKAMLEELVQREQRRRAAVEDPRAVSRVDVLHAIIKDAIERGTP